MRSEIEQIERQVESALFAKLSEEELRTWRECTVTLAAWLWEGGPCPEFPCWVCQEVKRNEEIGGWCCPSVFAEPLCIACTRTLNKLGEAEVGAVMLKEGKDGISKN